MRTSSICWIISIRTSLRKIRKNRNWKNNRNSC